MNYYDQHLHTYFSFDSEETFENYLKNQPKFFVSTEHFDLKNPYSNFKDDIPNYQNYVNKLAMLAASTDTTFIKGIELGIVPGQEATIKDYLIEHPYDLKIVSIHQNGRFDYMEDNVLKRDKYSVATEYFEQMSQVLSSFHEGDILAHFDYGLRRFDFTEEELAQHFEKLLTEIFRKTINLDMAFELNAKSFVKYGNSPLYHYAIPLYISLGGKYFTLGSDAHIAEDYELGFPEMSQLLRKLGVSTLIMFQDKKRIITDLPF